MPIDKAGLHLAEVHGQAETRALFEMLDIDFPRGARIPLALLRRVLGKGVVKAVFLCDGVGRVVYY